MQNVLQPEQIVLRLQVAVAGAPQVIELAGQVSTQAFLAPLFQQPAYVAGQLPAKTTLLLGSSQPAGQKEVVLCGRGSEPVEMGGMQRNQPALGKMTDVQIFFIHNP